MYAIAIMAWNTIMYKNYILCGRYILFILL